MNKRHNNFLFREEYESWLKSHKVSQASVNSYCLQTKYPGTDFTYLDIIGAFAYEKDDVCALAACAKWKAEIDNSKVSLKTKLNKNDYIAKYELFIKHILTYNIILKKSDIQRFQTIKQSLSSIKSELLNSISTDSTVGEGIQIDGMDAIIVELGTERFIKLAIESSYFFSPELCKERFEQIKKIWQEKEETPDPMFEGFNCPYIPARYSEKDEDNMANGIQVQLNNPDMAVFKLNSKEKSIRIYQENYRGGNKNYGGGNGNARVCQLIKKVTGYDLGAPVNKKSFKNYIISHIWGKATDPRYFTNLWNIVIVPAWANHLLDKDEDGTLSSTFKSTIMHIMHKLYDMEKYQWDKIDIPNYPSYSAHYSLKGEYIINVTFAKDDNEKFGKIKREKITLSSNPEKY